MLGLIYTFKPAHAVNSVKQSLVLKGHIFLVLWENSILIEPLLRGHLSYKATFSLSQRWPLNTVLGCIVLIIVTWCSILWPFIVGWLCFQYRDIDFWLFKEFHENANIIFSHFPEDFQFFNWFHLFPSGKKLLKIAGHSENRSKMDHLKGDVDGFSYFSLIFSYFIF
jgi:hypothetical protein